MNLRKINNFALKLALALSFVGASALSSLLAVQAQATPYPTVKGQYVALSQGRQRQYYYYYYTRPQGQQQRQGQPEPVISAPAPDIPTGMEDPYKQGIYWGQEDGQEGEEFRPCAHKEYIRGDKHFRRAFIRGYSDGYFSASP